MGKNVELSKILFLLLYLQKRTDMDIVKNLQRIKSEIGENIKLIAVSKTKPKEMILELYNAGHKIFGENRVQELTEKYQELPKDIEWHMIGHLQTNKVKYIVPFISMIHSIDSLKLLKEVDKRARKVNRVIDCLLEIHIAKEQTKFGFSFEEAEELIKSGEIEKLKNIRIVGLMGMATFTDDEKIIREEFGSLKEFFDKIKNVYYNNKVYFKELSMGMSNDYHIAIEYGATMVRIGSKIFGARS